MQYPNYVCFACGTLYGRRAAGNHSTNHMSECGVCKRIKPVTQPRDFGHLKAGWEQHEEPLCLPLL